MEKNNLSPINLLSFVMVWASSCPYTLWRSENGNFSDSTGIYSAYFFFFTEIQELMKTVA